MPYQIRYCTTEDGVRIGYTVLGDGKPLLSCPGTIESFALDHIGPNTRGYNEELGRGRMLILYDMRGTGVSQRDVTDFSGTALAADIKAVVDDIGIDRIDVVASNLSGPRAIRFAADYPERVDRLVLFDTSADPHEAFPYDSAMGLAELARANWKLAVQLLAEMGSRSLAENETQRAHVGEIALQGASLMEQSTTGENYANLVVQAFQTWAVKDRLRDVRSETLVVHHQDNFVWDVSNGQSLAAGIPGATFLPIAGFGSGPLAMGQFQESVAIIHDFLDGRQPGSTAAGLVSANNSGTAIIMFADIVDSTVLTEKLGDAAFREKARDLDASLRATIRGNGGTPIEGKLLGDGVLATFPSASQGIAAALACGKAGEDGGLPLHLGLHAGDVIREENNVFGGAVNVASRISGLSAAGEVLLSDVVRSLARTSAGVSFEDRGEQQLKGVGEAVRVWAVAEGG